MNSNKDFSIMQDKEKNKSKGSSIRIYYFWSQFQMDESKSTSYSANFVYKQTLGSEVKTFFGGEQNSDFRNRFLEV